MTQNTRAPTGKLSPGKIAAYAGIVVLACALVCLFFPDVFINPFLKGRIIQAITKGYPANTTRIGAVHYDIWGNRLECDALRMITSDSTLVFSVAGISVTGIDRISVLLGRDPSDILAVSRADANDVRLNFPQSQHTLTLSRLKISVPDSSLTIDSLRYHPPLDDGQFFTASGFRRTRYRLFIPRCRLVGLASPEGISKKDYRVRSVLIEDALLSVLINKEKPANDTASPPRMPAEILASIGGSLHVDRIKLVNGRLVYMERFDTGSSPAVLACDSIQVTAERIDNTAGHRDTAVIRARGILMGAGEVSVRMSIPVASSDLSFRYSGSLGGMDLARFNPFVEVSEGLRFKTGILHSAGFEIDVTAGKAVGVARVVYEDLKIVAIEDRTGSERGVGNTIISFIANNIKLRTTNMPDGSDSMKVGEVRYERNSEETFLEFAWFALRSGISDVVGF